MIKRNCLVHETGIAIEALADALDPDRRKPFQGDICDLLEWATKNVLAMRQQLDEREKHVTLLLEFVKLLRDYIPSSAIGNMTVQEAFDATKEQ